MKSKELAHKATITSGEERIKVGAWVALGLIVLLAFLHYFLVDRNSIVFSIPIGFLSFVLILLTYFWTKKTDRFRFGNEKRHQFIRDEQFMNIRSRIEHNDIELQVIVAATNSPRPYEPNLLPSGKAKELHELFDAYLNWVEGFAILWKSGLIEDSELEGLWQYYPIRLSEANIAEDAVRRFLSAEWNYNQTEIDEFFDFRKKTRQFPYPSDPLGTRRKINPVTQPIWFYVNRPKYVYTALLDLVKAVR